MPTDWRRLQLRIDFDSTDMYDVELRSNGKWQWLAATECCTMLGSISVFTNYRSKCTNNGQRAFIELSSVIYTAKQMSSAVSCDIDVYIMQTACLHAANGSRWHFPSSWWTYQRHVGLHSSNESKTERNNDWITSLEADKCSLTEAASICSILLLLTTSLLAVTAVVKSPSSLSSTNESLAYSKTTVTAVSASTEISSDIIHCNWVQQRPSPFMRALRVGFGQL